MKIKPTEDQDFKTFEIDIKEINWKKRCELNDKIIKEQGNGHIPSFSWWGDIVLKYTDLKEDELNKYTTDEIQAIANAIFEVANKKNKRCTFANQCMDQFQWRTKRCIVRGFFPLCSIVSIES